MNDDLINQVEQARARVQTQVDAARARHLTLNATIDEIKTLTATAHSPHGEVTVTATMEGMIPSVKISPHSLTDESLGRVITATIAAAQQKVREMAADRLATVTGEDADLVTELRTPMTVRGAL